MEKDENTFFLTNRQAFIVEQLRYLNAKDHQSFSFKVKMHIKYNLNSALQFNISTLF